jgi:hypothetical protein
MITILNSSAYKRSWLVNAMTLDEMPVDKMTIDEMAFCHFGHNSYWSNTVLNSDTLWTVPLKMYKILYTTFITLSETCTYNLFIFITTKSSCNFIIINNFAKLLSPSFFFFGIFIFLLFQRCPLLALIIIMQSALFNCTNISLKFGVFKFFYAALF